MDLQLLGMHTKVNHDLISLGMFKREVHLQGVVTWDGLMLITYSHSLIAENGYI